MADNTLGRTFKISSFGESHGNVVGIVVDGVPAGLSLDVNAIQEELNKRKPGQSKLTTIRSESDEVEILSGLFKGKTSGAPLCLVIRNKDVDSSKYEKFKDFLRPSHVDFVALKKYGGFADYRGSGRFSGRITAGFVMAGAIAKQVLELHGISMLAYTRSIGKVKHDTRPDIAEDVEKFRSLREQSLVRALNSDISKKMEHEIEKVKRENDSIGGTITCIVRGFPKGVGGPVFNSLEGNLSKAIFSIPAIKGIEFGAGFKAAQMRGSEHNDPWIIEGDEVRTRKNDAGGIIGGISTGMPIEFNVVVKPPATIGITQDTVNIKSLKETKVQLSGRHDPCIVPRAIVVVEAMTAVVLLDFLLLEGLIPSVLDK